LSSTISKLNEKNETNALFNEKHHQNSTKTHKLSPIARHAKAVHPKTPRPHDQAPVPHRASAIYEIGVYIYHLSSAVKNDKNKGITRVFWTKQRPHFTYLSNYKVGVKSEMVTFSA